MAPRYATALGFRAPDATRRGTAAQLTTRVVMLSALLGALCAGCESDPDVVATFASLGDGGPASSEDPEPVFGPDPTTDPSLVLSMDPTAGLTLPPEATAAPLPEGCNRARIWLHSQLGAVWANKCIIPADDAGAELITAIGLISLFAIVYGTEPAHPEDRPPHACDFALGALYLQDDPTNPTQYEVCPRYCDIVAAWVSENQPPPECK